MLSLEKKSCGRIWALKVVLKAPTAKLRRRWGARSRGRHPHQGQRNASTSGARRWGWRKASMPGSEKEIDVRGTIKWFNGGDECRHRRVMTWDKHEDDGGVSPFPSSPTCFIETNYARFSSKESRSSFYIAFVLSWSTKHPCIHGWWWVVKTLMMEYFFNHYDGIFL
jgi:hypothetical protein